MDKKWIELVVMTHTLSPIGIYSDLIVKLIAREKLTEVEAEQVRRLAYDNPIDCFTDTLEEQEMEDFLSEMTK